MSAPRQAQVKRETAETSIELTLVIDGSGTSQVATGIGFLDHLLATLAKHARFDLVLTCRGDLAVDGECVRVLRHDRCSS